MVITPHPALTREEENRHQTKVGGPTDVARPKGSPSAPRRGSGHDGRVEAELPCGVSILFGSACGACHIVLQEDWARSRVRPARAPLVSRSPLVCGDHPTTWADCHSV